MIAVPLTSSTDPGGDPRQDEAFVTVVPTDDFVAGAEVMFYSLREHTRIRRLHVVVITSLVSAMGRRSLEAAADQVFEVEAVPVQTQQWDSAVPAWSKVGLTTLRIWGLTQFKRVVFIDADTLILDCIDELFDRDVDFAAAPAVFPPDKFHTGVMVITPSQSVMEDMLSKRTKLPSFDDGEVGFINAYFPDWFTSSAAARLPFGYNALRTVYDSTYKSSPGFWDAIRPLKIIHYCGFPKPWQSKVKGELELMWWHKHADMETEAQSLRE